MDKKCLNWEFFVGIGEFFIETGEFLYPSKDGKNCYLFGEKEEQLEIINGEYCLVGSNLLVEINNFD